jgi:hypothetical protein
MSKWIMAVTAVVVVTGAALAKGPVWVVDRVEDGVTTLASVDGSQRDKDTTCTKWPEGTILNENYTINHKATNERYAKLHRKFRALQETTGKMNVLAVE